MPDLLAEDDDSWLNIDEEDFDSMLEKNMNSVKTGSRDPDLTGKMEVDTPHGEDTLTSLQAGHLKTLASKVEEFVEGKGDVERARFKE